MLQQPLYTYARTHARTQIDSHEHFSPRANAANEYSYYAIDILKEKIKIPTYRPIFFWHVTVNTTFVFACTEKEDKNCAKTCSLKRIPLATNVGPEIE